MVGKYAFVVLFAGCLSLVPMAWGCDCTHFPITPAACLKPCQTAALFKSDQNELTSIFGLDDSTAKLLVNKRASLPSESSYELKQVIPSNSYSKIVAGASSISAEDTSKLALKYKLDNVDTDSVINRSAKKPQAKNR
ncbi:hypothetical protein [Terriglobus sp. TAA 43]|uniref:hypothetical protein n=1 Tax=Terriglobus sp. TAA 43 TaxID=278961 RepID=UPI000648A389|nr:hypothetical protein [Terriglobus sp. TAA 43]